MYFKSWFSFLLIFLFFAPVWSVGQDIDIYLFGEDHGMDNASHKLDVIKDYNSKYGIKEVAIELPIELEFSVNDYIRGNDASLSSIKSESFQNKKDLLKFIVGLKELNKATFDGGLKVHCFDISSRSGKSSFFLLRKFVESNNEDWSQEVLEILNNGQLNALGKVELMRRVIRSNEELFKNYDDYILEILNGIELVNSYGKVNAFNDSLLYERELLLARRLSEIKDSSVRNQPPLLVFTGTFHVNNIEFDSTTMSHSLNYLLKEKYGRKTFGYATVYFDCKRTLVDRFFDHYIDYVDFDVEKKLLENGNPYYMLYCPMSESDSIFLHERFDGLLIRNCGYKSG